MILVTQGHERSIGLEVFLKSFILLSENDQKKFRLYVNKKTLQDVLSSIGFDFLVEKEFIKFGGNKLNCKFIIPDSASTLSLNSLNTALEEITEKDILVTLPTSKDQLKNKDGKILSGYTEYFRDYFKSQNIVMAFHSDDEIVLLITDHLALNKVTEKINSNLIEGKIAIFQEYYPKYFNAIDEFVYAGINPHAGEGGILGTGDGEITSAIAKLSKKTDKVRHVGPFAGDTLHIHKKPVRQVLTYMYHDQGLSRFKSEHGFIGLNVTLGLPFLRLSVDHGTAFDLFGKNCADYAGMAYLCKTSLKINRKLNV